MVLYTCVKDLYIRGVASTLEITTDGETLTVAFTGYANAVYIQYGGARVKSSGGKASFAYDDTLKSVSLELNRVQYGSDVFPQSPYTVSWTDSFTAETPSHSFSCRGLGDGNAIFFDWSGEDFSRVIAVDMYKNGERTRIVKKPTAVTPVHLSATSFSETDEVYFVGYIASYASADADDTEYTSIDTVTTEVIPISKKSAPYAPPEIRYAAPVPRGKLTIGWTAPNDEVYPPKSYILEKSENGGEYAVIFKGGGTEFCDSISADCESVAYRVAAVGRIGIPSAWREGAILEKIPSNVYVSVGGRLRAARELHIGGKGSVNPIIDIIPHGV